MLEYTQVVSVKLERPKADDFQTQKPRQINNSSLILYFLRTLLI